MYPGFPEEVMNADDLDLFFNAVIHYFSFGSWFPESESEQEVKFPFSESVKYKMISLGTEEDLYESLKNVIGSSVSISKQDFADIAWAVKNITDIKKVMPEEVPMKEISAFLAGMMIKEKKPVNEITAFVKTATDVLRAITAMTEINIQMENRLLYLSADVSLAENTKFKPMKRYERRMIMDILSELRGSLLEDLFRYEEKWKRVCHFLHQNEFKAKKYANVASALNTVCAGEKPEFFNKKVNDLFVSKKYVECSGLLMERPGEFARKLDALLRNEPSGINREKICCNFALIAEKLPVPMLLSLRSHFYHRNEDKDDIRIFMPKSGKGVYVKEEKLAKIDEDVRIGAICDIELMKKFSKKEPMGKVYIAENFRDLIIPFAQRNASASLLKPKTKGSRIKFDHEKNIVRPFIWWTNMYDKISDSDERIDLDLSVGFYNESWGYEDHVSYTNLKNQYSVHSGDIVDGGPSDGKGVAEFIDINIKEASEVNVRYAVIELYSFSGQPMSSIPNRFGLMLRERSDTGEIFEPKTVEINGSVTSNGDNLILGVIDLKEHTLVWGDTPGHLGGNKSVSLENNLKGATAIAYTLCNMKKTSLYDLVRLNAISRGQIVSDRNEADIIFDDDERKPTIETVDESGKTVVKEKENVKIIPSYDISYFFRINK